MEKKQKRKILSLKTKIEILRDVDRKVKKGAIAAKYGIAASSLSTILRDREKIERANNKTVLRNDRKRVRSAVHSDVEQALYTWFSDVRARNVPISGPLLKAKASHFATALGKDFRPGNGWLERFKKRYNIGYKSICGESNVVNTETCAAWLRENSELICNFNPRDVYNCDETGLFYQLTPNKTMHIKGQACHGGKNSKARITIMCCCNMDGTHKTKLLIIGKAKKPHCFSQVSHMPVIYRNNTKAWMTKALFEEWLISFDKEMGRANRRVLLIMDNCTAHNITPNLPNVTLLLLPPNVTSKLQPLDQGIIENMKLRYRTRLIERILVNIRCNREDKITLWTAIQMVNGAWGNVKESTIANCWKHAGFIFGEADTDTDTDTSSLEELDNESQSHWQNNGIVSDSDEDAEDVDAGANDMPTRNLSSEDNETIAQQLEKLWRELPDNAAEEQTITEYLSADADIDTCEELSDETIIQSLQTAPDTVEEDNDDEEVIPVTTNEVLDSLDKIHRYLVQNALLGETGDAFVTIENAVLKDKLKKNVQKPITHFFKHNM